MTIKRQYTLPYCNLILEGLSANVNDPLSPLTVLMNAECRFPGVTGVTLAGGREFLDSLVTAVSRYGQQLLSGVPQPRTTAGSTPPLVDLKPGDRHDHHLIVRQQPLGEPATDANALAPLDIRLTTVQFYDLMEVVDQLLADSQTLPDLTAQFQAVSRRWVKPAEPVTKRAAPAVLGAAALAAAGLALFFVPPPRLEPNRPSRETNPPAETSPSPRNSRAQLGQAAEDGVSSLEQLAQAPALTDAATIARLQSDLTRRLQADWTADPKPSQALTYRVVVSEGGDILGYKYANDQALAEVAQTPLAALSVDPVATAQPVEKAVTQFRVTFTPAGQVVVEPWEADQAGIEADTTPELPALATKITDGDRIRRLNRTLYDRLVAQLKPLSTSEPLTYRVRLSANGDILGYEPLNAAANLMAQETPLPSLMTTATPAPEQADFRVVFTETGVLQVSPWEGWPQ